MEINNLNYQTAVLEGSYDKPILIQFHAPWCGACRALKPVMEEVYRNSEYDFELVFLDVNANPDLAQRFQILSIPNVKMIQDGKILTSFVGYKPAHAVRNWLDNNLELIEDSPTADIEFQLENNETEKVKESLLELAIQENPQSDYLKLLMAMQHLETNNANALQWIQKVERGGELDALTKRIRDKIDMDVEDQNITTPSASPFTSEPEKVNDKIRISTFDPALMVHLIEYGLNKVRQKKGLSTLQSHPILTQAATDQNNYQLQKDSLTHYQENPSKKLVQNRVESFGGGFRMVGENVQFKGFPVRTWGTSKEIITPTYLEAAEAIVRNWIDSPGHYRNMVRPEYQFVGTAVGWNPENAAVFVTQVFGAE